MLKNIDIDLNMEDANFFQNICLEEYNELRIEDLYKALKIISKAIHNNRRKHFFDNRILCKVLCKKVQIVNIQFMKNEIIGKWQALKISAQLSALSCSARPIMNWIKAYLGDLLVNI